MEITNTNAEIAEWEAKALATREKLNDHQILSGQVDRDREFYEKLLLSMHDVDQSHNLNVDTVSVMERASIADLVPRDRTRPIAMGAVGGALLAVVLLLALDRLDDRIRSVSDYSLNFHEDLLGVIPAVPGRHKTRIKPLEPNDNRFLYSEGYRKPSFLVSSSRTGRIRTHAPSRSRARFPSKAKRPWRRISRSPWHSPALECCSSTQTFGEEVCLSSSRCPIARAWAR